MSEIPRIGGQPSIPSAPALGEEKESSKEPEKASKGAATKDVYEPADPNVQKSIDSMPIQQTDFQQLRASRKAKEAGIDPHEMTKFQASESTIDSASRRSAAKVDQKKTESPQGSSTYVVQRGDTVSKIAKNQGVTVRDIAIANPGLKDPNKIHPGQELVIPKASARARAGDASSAAPTRAPAGTTAPKTPDLDGAGRVTRGPESPETIDFTKDPAFKALPPDKQAKLLDSKNDPAYTYLDRKIKFLEEQTRDPAFGKISQKKQENIRKDIELSRKELQQLKDAPPLGLQKVVNHELYGKLSTEQKTKLLNVYASADEKGKAELPTLMNRQVSVEVGSGMPAQRVPALLSKDNRE